MQVEANSGAAGVIYHLIGGLYLAKGNAAAAEEAFRVAIQKSPQLLSPYYALAGIYLKGQKAEKAIELFTQLLSVNHKQAAAHMMIAVIYDSQKKTELSEKHYRACLEIDPKFAPAANNLAYLLAESNRDLNEALKYAQTAKRILPEDPSVMDTLGWVYFRNGLYDLAISELKGSLAKAPKAPSSESASTLVPRVAQALSRPGISRDVVFKGKVKNAFSYSVDPTDTSRVVRVAADGSRSVGRLVKGRFVTVKAA